MSNHLKNTHDLEKDLAQFYQQAEPRTEFADTLENTLLQARAALPPKAKKGRPRFFRSRLTFASMTAAVLLALVVTLIGPRQVLAQVQGWLGYVPGYGFVDVAGARALVQPVAHTQGDVTITIKQVLVDQEHTYIILGIDGLPTEDEIYNDMHDFITANIENWPEIEETLWRVESIITLPDGTQIGDGHFSGAPWAGYFVFPPLPPGVVELSFDFDRISGLLPEVAPHNWHFDIQLGYVSDSPNIDEYSAQSPQIEWDFPTPIAVDAPSEPDPVYGFNLELIDVVYAETETALRVSIDGIPADWQEAFGYLDGRLVDDLGNDYGVIYGPTSGRMDDGSYVLTFEPLHPDASGLTLTVVNIGFSIPIGGQLIVADFGAAPQVGDYIPLDQTVMVLDTSVHFAGIQIVQEPAHTDEQTLLNMFEFVIDPITVQNGVIIGGVGFIPDLIDQLGGGFGGGGGGGGGGGIDPENMEISHLSFSIGMPATVPLPTGSFEFNFDTAQIMLQGPYTLTWEVNPAK